jgi:hypothetical protein
MGVITDLTLGVAGCKFVSDPPEELQGAAIVSGSHPPAVMASRDALPDRMVAKIVSPRRQASPELPDWPRIVEARLIERIAAPLTGGKRLV